MNGLENMRSILAAFSARVRSRARANGCCNGSKFLCVGVGSPGRAGRWAEGACCRTDIFCEIVGQKHRHRVEYNYHHGGLGRGDGIKFGQFGVISQLTPALSHDSLNCRWLILLPTSGSKSDTDLWVI
jgi:hypothetical protein